MNLTHIELLVYDLISKKVNKTKMPTLLIFDAHIIRTSKSTETNIYCNKYNYCFYKFVSCV